MRQSDALLKPVHTGDNLSPFRATFVAVFGDYSFGYNLSPFSATFVASVDRLLGVTLLSSMSSSTLIKTVQVMAYAAHISTTTTTTTASNSVAFDKLECFD